MKLDPYKHEERWFNWKAKTNNQIPNLSKTNSKLILDYLFDMEKGINIASFSVKGSRSSCRLNSLRNRMIFFAKKFKQLYNLDNITQIKEEKLIGFFSDMKSGNIKREDGKKYKNKEIREMIIKKRKQVKEFYKQRDKKDYILKFIQLTPLMYWVAFKRPVPEGVEQYDPKKDIIKNITTTLMNKLKDLENDKTNN